MTIFAITLLCLLAALAIGLIAASLYFYRVAISRRGNERAMAAASAEAKAKQAVFTPPEVMAWIREQPLEDVAIVSVDGLTLRGFFLPAREPSDRTAILMHGYTGDALGDMGSLARLYRETFGFNVLMPDARGHGKSDGRYIGFGWHERKDCLQWIHYVVGRVGTESQIVLHGLSMGGATVLMASGERLPRQVKGVVSDCAYTSARDILAYQLKSLTKLPAFPIVPLTSLVCRLRAGYGFGEASALKQVARSDRPTLFIHGDADAFVPFGMVHRLYDGCSAAKEKLVIPGAGHGLAFSADQAAYAGALGRFLDRYTTERPVPVPDAAATGARL